MILVKPSHSILSIYGLHGDPLKLIEVCGRTCYKSENKITADSEREFVKRLNNLGHHSVLEHSAMTVKFICDRGVSHELVRHRLCAFSQESTRYCNYYKGGVTFVIPPWVCIKPGKYSYIDLNELSEEDHEWSSCMYHSELAYTNLLNKGWSPQQARSVLPNSLKTEVCMTTNFREWKYIFNLRCSNAAHPQMRELMIPLLNECKERIPVIFDDLTY